MLDAQNNVTGFYYPTILAFIGLGFCLWMFYEIPIEHKTTDCTMEIWLPIDSGKKDKKARFWPDDPVENLVCESECEDEEEIRVLMKWDAPNEQTKVTLNKRPVKDADTLETFIQKSMDEYTQSGKTIILPLETTESREQGDIMVIIDAVPDIPWQDVVGVVDICKKLNIAVEFADYPSFRYYK